MELNGKEYEVLMRKYNSDDITMLRDYAVELIIQDKKKQYKTHFGKMMKATVILSIKKCPWFSHDVDMRHGITEEIWDTRVEEFKQIPVEVLDDLFKKCGEFNKTQVDKEQLLKN